MLASSENHWHSNFAETMTKWRLRKIQKFQLCLLCKNGKEKQYCSRVWW